MASSRPRDELPIEAPRKRQKLSAPPSEQAPSTATESHQEPATQATEPAPPPPGGNPAAKMDEPVVKMAITETGFQPEREKECGILHFVNESNPGFTGVLKQRYVLLSFSLERII